MSYDAKFVVILFNLIISVSPSPLEVVVYKYPLLNTIPEKGMDILVEITFILTTPLCKRETYELPLYVTTSYG